MSNIIDKITFEVRNHPYHEEVKYVTLLWKGNIVADATCYIGASEFVSTYVSISKVELKLAEYLSLSKDDIKKLIRKFVLDGGLGIDGISHIIW